MSVWVGRRRRRRRRTNPWHECFREWYQKNGELWSCKVKIHEGRVYRYAGCYAAGGTELREVYVAEGEYLVCPARMSEDQMTKLFSMLQIIVNCCKYISDKF